MIEVLIFDQAGRNPVEIAPALDYVTWRINQVGQARFSLAYTDPNCTPDVMRLGNRVLIRFDDGLPPFGGVIDVPRRRSRDGITVTAYGGEQILSWRRTARTESYSGSAGSIVQSLIEAANARWPTGIAAGQIYTGGATRSETYHYQKILEQVQRLVDLSGDDIRVEPVYRNGQLSFDLHWLSELGADQTDQVLLCEGLNAHEVTVDEQGPVASEIVVVGGDAGTLWPDKPTGLDSDIASRNAYGYREHVEVTAGQSDQTTLDASAAALAGARNNPRVHIRLLAYDSEPGPFARYDVGDRVQLQAMLNNPSWSYDHAVRIESREWRPNNTCTLEVVEWV